MSGIAGIYYLDGRPVERTDVERMVDSIAHRGPDGCGVWTDGSVGLGHRMLWTTPESLHEKLPLTNKTGDLTITADARIDNRDEVTSALNFNGRPRETITDCEIILAAYEKWGEKCPEKLLGDFSFAIWDKRNQKIYCARDPIGIKPFYYYFEGGKFRWSSEPKAIFEDSEIPKEPNLQLICLYLLNRFDEREETLYKDIYRLPPSHFMVIENGKIRKDQYWDIDPNYSIRYKTDEEYAEHFLTLFKEAVRVRLRSHGPVGALLSGGLDSSSIVCTAQKLYQENSIPKYGFETFSIVFDTFPCDERPYINEVVQKWNVHANYFRYEDHLPSVDFEQTQKYCDVGYFLTLLFLAPAFKEAQRKGINVMLDGIGGDDLLAVDIDHLTDFIVQGKIWKLMLQLRYDSTLYSSSVLTLLLNYCLKPLIPQSIRTFIKQILRMVRGNGIPMWINGAVPKQVDIVERVGVKQSVIRFPTHAQQHMYQGLRCGWNVNIVQDIADRFAAIFGIEKRYPFFDRRLIEFSFGLPDEQRWGKKGSKAILRNGMKEILPDAIRNRIDKTEFSPLIDHELKQRQCDKLNVLLRSSILKSFGLINVNELGRQLCDYRQEIAKNNVRYDLEKFIWLETWLSPTIGRS